MARGPDITPRKRRPKENSLCMTSIRIPREVMEYFHAGDSRGATSRMRAVLVEYVANQTRSV